MTAILYDYWRSSSAYRVRLALALKKVEYERVPVDLTAAEQRSASHLALNPQGLVPVLQIDGHIFTQSLAIIEYLDETRPAPSLLPSDAAGRAHVRALALAIACEIHPLCNLRVLKQVEAIANTAAKETWNRNNIIRGLEAFELMLGHPDFHGPYCYGDTPSLADCTLIPQLYNATRWGVEWRHLPKISAIADRCAELAEFQAAAPEQVRP